MKRNEQVRAEIERLTGTSMPDPIAADMGDLDQVRELAGRIAQCEVLIHNAGALTAEYTVGASGIESTVASQVVGPFLLTALLADRLKVSGRGRVLTMASGGMYTAAVTVSQLEMTPDEYNGTTQYARAKRAQVTLNEMWATRFATSSDSTADAVVAHALHPGWVDTPGVEQALPVFRKTVGPLLRTPAQGADTLVWLAADDTKPLAQTGLFWHDRRPRAIHRLGSTRRSDTSDRRSRLWDWCVGRCGVDFE